MENSTRSQLKTLMRKIKRWFFDSDDAKVPLDHTLLVILCRIILYSTEGLDLDNPAKVERLRERYCAILWKYLVAENEDTNYSRSKLAARFGQGLMIGSVARDVLNITNRERKNAGVFVGL